MPRKSSTRSAFPIFDLAITDTRLRQEHQAREFARMNQRAARSVQSNAAVIRSGALDNAAKAVLPVLTANAQRRRRPRR